MDFDKKNLLTPPTWTARSINAKIRALMADGVGDITLKNPGAKHSLAVGLLNRLRLNIEGSLGYFGCGLIDVRSSKYPVVSAGHAGKT